MLRLGRAGGVLSASWARSQHAYEDDGTQYGVGYEWQSRRFSVARPPCVAVMTSRRGERGRQPAAAAQRSRLPRHQSGKPPGRRRLRAPGPPGEPRARYATLSASQRLHRRAHLGSSLSRDLDGARHCRPPHLSLLLDDDRQAWASARRRDFRPRPGRGRAPRAAGRGRRLGLAGAGGHRRQRRGRRRSVVQASTGSGMPVRWSARRRDTDTTGYFEGQRGLLWMQGGLFPMRQASTPFALFPPAASRACR